MTKAELYTTARHLREAIKVVGNRYDNPELIKARKV
jgi:hypothetical protein